MLSDEWNGPWVQIDGYAEVIDSPDSVEPLVEYYRNIAGEHPDWDEYREAMLKQGKSIIRVTPERWGPVATGGSRRGWLRRSSWNPESGPGSVWVRLPALAGCRSFGMGAAPSGVCPQL